MGIRGYVQDGVPGITPNHLSLIDQSGTTLQAMADGTAQQTVSPGTSANPQTQVIGVQQAVPPVPASVLSVSVPPLTVAKSEHTASPLSILGRVVLIGLILLCLIIVWLMRLRSGTPNISHEDAERQIEPVPSEPRRAAPETAPRVPFQFLSSVPAAQIQGQLEQEHPQTVALILAQLPEAESSSLLAGLSSRCRAEVAPRMAALGELGPNVIRAVERALAHSLNQPSLGSPVAPELTERAA